MVFPATLYRLIIALNGYDGPEYYQAGDGLMKPGMICMFDDADEVKICTSTGKPLGVIGCDADHDLGTVYALGERIPVYPLGCGVDMYVIAKATMTVEIGSIMETEDETTLVGHGRLKTAYVILTTANVTANGTERNLTSGFWIGKAIEAGAVTTAVTRYIPVKLSL